MLLVTQWKSFHSFIHTHRSACLRLCTRHGSIVVRD